MIQQTDALQTRPARPFGIASNPQDTTATTYSSTLEQATIPAEALPPTQLDLQTLLRRCQIESEKFYRGQPHDTRFSYELFRRAIVERDTEAWELLYNHYSSLVEGWVRRSSAFGSTGESSEFFVNRAFEKYWSAMTPERFERFPDLASLLRYLQLCTSSVIIDSVRAQSWAEIVGEEALPRARGPYAAPDEEAEARVGRQEFWSFIESQLNSEQERVVVHCSFVMGMTPRAIFAKHAAIFEAISDVYNVKRNVLGRLSRSPHLRQFMEA
jgi:DNA-directed RNA polymerase specialized sigma24 family protein